MSTAQNIDNRINEYWPKDGPANTEIEKYIKKYSKERIVIKCGGRVLLDPNLFDNFINDVMILKKLGLTPVVVHGGGPRIKKKLNELNIETKFIMGLRVTDEKVIKVVEEVMIEFNKEIVDALKKKECNYQFRPFILIVTYKYMYMYDPRFKERHYDRWSLTFHYIIDDLWSNRV